MRFIPNTADERREMLKRIGVKNFDFSDLLSPIPEHLRLKSPLELPPALSELEIKKLMQGLSERNISTDKCISFLGAGSYDHYIPQAVDYVIRRPEFYTAYTPYQAEASQGTLQTIYEYQSMICELTGMEVANASMYDGASALAEACYMARTMKEGEILISEGVHPSYIQCVETYLGKVHRIPLKDGRTDINALKEGISRYAPTCVVVQHPNFFGVLEPVEELGALIHKNNSLYIGIPLPISLGVLAPPGDWGAHQHWGADIVVAEGQSLGIPQSFGGPGLGIFATRREWIRKMPGRIIGRTEDVEGKRGFVMTLQTREQHIRRERATSNICTNEGLCAIATCVYLTVMGAQGIREVGEICYEKAHYLAKRISEVPGFSLSYDTPFFNEFLVHTPIEASQIVKELLKDNIFAGIPMSKFYKERTNELLIAVTEKRTREELDYFVEKLKSFNCSD
ncbi:aminomethyl-transferring glycine dehydrogenase subunit GcvPA [candidate division WOR-3 bacterium]|nr:aminomethyl-transferring glycine dehydrogenase subunit GcvPA [candidate division WOR-3 bacterium]